MTSIRLNHCLKLGSTIGKSKRLPFCILNLSRKMSESDHLTRTAENTRHEIISPATVTSITDATPTVKRLILKVHNYHLSFKAGQWVDCMIPGISTVGGYSMTSSPNMLTSQQRMDLAVKYSTHPPAYWVHTQCKEGSEVELKVGGDFFYDPKPGEPVNMLLIAGGVGINPLFSILQVASQQVSKPATEGQNTEQKVTLLYSASSNEELLFKEEIMDLCRRHDKFICRFFLTKDTNTITEDFTKDLIYKRIDQDTIKAALQQHDIDGVQIYICGPGPMIEDMENYLIQQGAHKDNIHYEKWW